MRTHISTNYIHAYIRTEVHTSRIHISTHGDTRRIRGLTPDDEEAELLRIIIDGCFFTRGGTIAGAVPALGFGV
jgi:hypothetical protein